MYIYHIYNEMLKLKSNFEFKVNKVRVLRLPVEDHPGGPVAAPEEGTYTYIYIHIHT